MKFKLIAAMVAVIAVAGFSSVQAQDCGCGGGYGAYSGVVEGSFGGYGSYGDVGYGPSNCYRGLSSAAASSLWAGYCTDDCSYKGPTRNGLLSRCKLRHGGGGGCGLGKGYGGGGGCAVAELLPAAAVAELLPVAADTKLLPTAVVIAEPLTSAQYAADISAVADAA